MPDKPLISKIGRIACFWTDVASMATIGHQYGCLWIQAHYTHQDASSSANMANQVALSGQ
jgi:hypothetical protein